ncbi:MAG: hypothetical protein U0768_12055 [Anaerolineae bacterium]
MSDVKQLETNGELSVRVRQDIAQHISEIAAQRHLAVDALVNDILQQYVADQGDLPNSTGGASLLSMAAMFNSGVSDTSENVRAVVTDFLVSRNKR